MSGGRGAVSPSDRDVTLASGLFGFAVELAPSDLPLTILHAAALRVIDTVGVALAGASHGYGHAGAQLVLAEAGGGESSVWATGGARRSPAVACLANGMLAHGMDYDDTHTRTTMHPGVVVVPAAIAVGEAVGASGHEVLTAVAIGYEVAARLGELAVGDFQRQGFHPSSVLGIFGATAAAARLMGVTAAQAAHAAGVAGSLASGLMEYLTDGSDTKQVHPGWAAQAAVRAVQFARLGVSGPATVLEGRYGLFRAFVDAEVDIAAGLRGLGRSWGGLDVATKPYAACHCVHAPVDAWRQIRDTAGLTEADVARIRRITALVPAWYERLVCDPIGEKRRPRSVYEARFSLPYALGRVVVDGVLTLDSFDQSQLGDPRVLAIAELVDYEIVEYDTFPEAFPAGLRVEMDDGSVHETHIRHNVGSVANPMTEAQIHAKFLEGAADDAGAELLDALRSLVRPGSSLAPFTTAMARIHTVGAAREELR